METAAFDRISARISPETRNHVSKTLDLVERIQAILKEKGMSQKDLALALGKNPSEISRWMTGLHNFEVKTLVKLEQALGVELFSVAEGETSSSVAKAVAAPSQPTGKSSTSISYMFSFATPAGYADLPDEMQYIVAEFIEFLKQKNQVSKERGRLFSVGGFGSN